MTHVNLLDLFSGIGGFHLGLEQAGFEFDWVGFSEIDKYAKQTYKKNFPNSKDLGDVSTIRHQDLPQIDIITFGSPCQDFSIAGKRAGLAGNRSSLVGEAIRLIADCKPRFFIWENVKGTFSSNDGADFWAIIKAFTDIGGYRLEWQLLNTRWFLPQNRERIYLVGHLGEGSGDEIFPIGGTNQSTEAIFIDESMRRKEKRLRFYNGYSSTLNTSQGGGHIPLIKIGDLKIIAKKRTFDTPEEINEYLKENKGNKTIREIAESLQLPKTQIEHYFRSDKYRAVPSPEIWVKLKVLLQFDDTYDEEVTSIYEKEVEFESTRRVYNENGLSPTINAAKKGGFIQNKSAIRRLTPTECERLQGFPDGWTEGQSDTQRYKQLGNAVSVPVVAAVGKKLNLAGKNVSNCND